MRDQPLVLPFGSIPGRKFFLSLIAILVAFFALMTTFSQPVHAQQVGAKWSGNSILYNGHQYVHMGEAKAGDSHKIPEGSPIYAYIEPAPGGNPTTLRKAHIIYFTPGTDPPTTTSATLASFDFLNGTFSNPGATQGITIEPSTGGQGTQSCDSGQFLKGMGWIICPITNFLAGAMDWLYDILSDFLAVRPMQTTQDNALFRAWSFMRNFANVAFVIAFIVIIYSQLSGIGISNYGIKKLLPKLVIAAILVNISYWICTVAVDLSNIAGYSIQNIFIDIRNGLVGPEGNSWDISWSDLANFILAGGAGVGVGVGLYALAAGSVGGAIYMLLPVLVGVGLAILVALLVMALRQALITILTVISPLIFAALILPNTEKYFDKGKDMFGTMLVMFPILSTIFGGSQLAGTLIIQNANSITIIILGMAVQVAPVVVTPLLIKFSGALISRVAGMVNNPNRGLIDRTRNWAQQQKDEHKARVLASTPRNGIRGFTARRTQNIENRRRRGKEWKAANEAYADAKWHNSADYRRIHAAGERAHMLKERGEALAEAHVNQLKTVNGHQMQIDETNLQVAKLQVDVTKARIDAMHEEMRAGSVPPNSGLATQVQNIQDASRDLALTAMRKAAAERTQKSELTDALLKNQMTVDGRTLREYAGGIRGQDGADTVLASSISAYRDEFGKMVAEKNQLIKHFNLDSNARQNLALGESVVGERVENGKVVRFTFRADDEYARDAAVSAQMKTGSEGQIMTIIKESGTYLDANGNLVKGKTYDYRTTISDDIPANGIPGKSLIFGSKIINDVGQGAVYGDDGLKNAAVYHIMDGKIRDDVLAVQGAETLKILYEVGKNGNFESLPQYANASDEKKRAFHENYAALRRSATKILRDEINRNASEAARKVFEDNKTDLPDDPTAS